MQLELTKQIEEKALKKEQEKQRILREEAKLDERVQQDLQQLRNENAAIKSPGGPPGAANANLGGSFKEGNTAATNYQNHHSVNVIGSSTGHKPAPSPGGIGQESIMGLMGGQGPAGGGVGKMQHSPVKPTVMHNVQMDSNANGQLHQQAISPGMSKAAQVYNQSNQVPMQPPAMDHGESIGGLMGQQQHQQPP